MNTSIRLDERLAAMQVVLEAVKEGREITLDQFMRTHAELTVAMCEDIVARNLEYMALHESYSASLKKIMRLVEAMA